MASDSIYLLRDLKFQRCVRIVEILHNGISYTVQWGRCLQLGTDALLAGRPFPHLGILPTVPWKGCRNSGRARTNLCELFFGAGRVHRDPCEPLMLHWYCTNKKKCKSIKKRDSNYSCSSLSCKVAASYSPALAVPSALQGLTSLFGMVRGGALVL